MATSRTGTKRWRDNRTIAITRARNEGLTRCPTCGRFLIWDTHGLPASPEADHITPHSRGGSDSIDNIQIICRACNLSKGNGRKPKPPKPTRRRKHIKPTTQ